MTKLLSVFAFLLFFTPGAAFALRMGGAGSFNYSVYSAAVTPKTSLGGYVFFEIPISENFGIEIGTNYTVRSHVLSSPANTVQSATYFQVPVFARYWVNQALSFGLGVAGSFGYMRVNREQVGGGKSELTYTGAGLLSKDLSAVGVVGINFPYEKDWNLSIFCDVRYLYGLTDVSVNSSASETMSDFQLVFGLRYGDLPGFH